MSEHAEQSMVIAWARMNAGNWPVLDMLHSIPNGTWVMGDRNRAAGLIRKMKQEGLTRGIPDLFLPAARGGFHGLYIEMKMPGNKLRREQEKVINALGEEGYLVAVCRSGEGAVEFIQAYLEGRMKKCLSA